MNEKYQQIYNYFKKNHLTDLDANTFYTKYSDPTKSKEIWSYLKQNNMTDLDANAFHASYFDVKKKEESQSTLVQDNTSSGRFTTTTTKLTVSSSLKGDGIYTIEGSGEGVFYKKSGNDWYRKVYGVSDYTKITDPDRIKKIESWTKPYKGPTTKSAKSDGIYTIEGTKEGIFYKKSGKDWYKKEYGKYDYTKVTDPERIRKIEAWTKPYSVKPKKAETTDKYSFETKPSVKEEEWEYTDTKGNTQYSIERNTIEYWDKLLASGKINKKTYDFQADRIASEGLYKSVVNATKPKEDTKKPQALFKESVEFYDENHPEFIRQKEIDDKLSFINSGFVGMNEEDVISKLKKVASGYDYIEVEESGAGYDEILVRNKITGETKKISLDNWTDERNQEESKRLYGWLNIQMNSKGYVNAYGKVQELQRKMNDATPYDRAILSQQLVDAQQALTKEKDKRAAKAGNDEYMESAIFTKAEVENVKTNLAEVQLKLEDVKAKTEDYESWSIKVKEAYDAGKISEEDYKNNYLPKLKQEKEAIRQEAINLNNEYLQASGDKFDIDQAAASNYLVESKRGNVLTGTTYAFLKGAENSWRFLIEQDPSLNEGDLQGFLTQLAPGSVSDVYTTSEGKSLFENIVFGLAESGGSAIAGLMTGAPAGATLGLYAASYVNMKDQMNAPEFRGIPEWQKILMSATYGVTVGYLEEFGLSKMFSKSPGGKGLTNWILKNVVEELPEDATAEMFELAVKKNYKAALANGLIQVNAAGLVEGSTELLQESADMVLKDVFNKLNGKEYFENPKTWGEVFDRLGTSFKLGYLGGAGMNSITQTAQTAKTEITKYQLNNIEDLITNPNTKEIYKLNIKDQVLLGNMKVKDAKQILSNLDELEATVNKIPKEIKDESKYQAFQLLNERDDLQKDIAGKDPALVAAQTERINAINDELKTISKNAVQERSTEEVLPRESETTGEAGGQREGMGQGVQGEIVAEEGPITQEEKVKRISELEGMIASDNASKQEVGRGNLIPEARQAITEELQTLKESKQEVAAPKAEIGGIIRGYQSISEQDNVGDVRSQLPNQNQGTAVVEGKDGNQYAVAFSRKGGDGKNIFEQGVTTPRPGYISASVKIDENATPEQVQAAQQEAQRNLDVILPTVVGGTINAQAINDVMVQQPVAQPSGKTGQLPVAEEDNSFVYKMNTERTSTGKGKWEDDFEIVDNRDGGNLGKEAAKWAVVNKITGEIVEARSKKDAADIIKNAPSYGLDMWGEGMTIDFTELSEKTQNKYRDEFNRQKSIKENKNLQETKKETNLAQDETGKIQPERTGDGRRRTESRRITPLEGAPSVPGINGPDPQIVGVAEKYAADNGIDLKRQAEYVELDEERAKRLADAYEQMADDPQNPKVKEAYQDLVNQTIAQYQALVDAGYKFWFMDFSLPSNEEYASTPYNALRDLRQNKEMGIFATIDGYGEDGITQEQIEANPMLADTGLMWPIGGIDGKMMPVLVNDLFRAVHDAFGHGLEGAGFRARGEENAWQAHVRLFTGPAIGAITSETRGQNSWVNFGPEAEFNRTASGADTKYATQKVGLMPEWTWTEGRAGDMEADVLTVDTKDATNLQKVLDALSKIEGDLDQFGKETLGVNIPVVLAKAIVKAVKALVKTGITLEQAIKQVAAENGLNDRDVKSLFNPKKVSEIDVNEVRSKSRPGKRVSKGISVKTVAGKKVIEETDGLSLEYVKENAPKVFISNANIIAKYPLIAGKQKFREATTVEQAQKIYDVFVREVADNLEYLMNEFKPEYRDISTLWYDGANAIANDFAEQFDVSPEQAAGIIAAMSPQKDWYQNVRLAELVLMAYRDNPVLTQDMIEYQKKINKTGLYETATSAGKKLKKAEKDYKESRTRLNKNNLDEAKVKMQEAINKADAIIKSLEKYLGQKLSDVPADMQPYVVRTYHEVNTTKDYNIVAPDGSVQGVAKNNDGTNSKVAWGSYGEIGKAVAIKNDGSQKNITRSLGEMHKIRNFYNNIIDPMSQDGDVTMDTHAIAAALLLPLAGKSTQVGQNFGTGTSNSRSLGIKGLYYAYADAYALAAKEAGLLPRQVQSITWEAVRGLYTDTFKDNKPEVAKINNIWKNYQDGKITINEAREQAKESAGGIKDPTWAGGPLQDESGASVQEESVGGGREGDGRDIVGDRPGGEILTADTKNPTVLKRVESALNKVDDDLAKFGRETLGINIPVATMRAIIKAAKVLVKTGITLQDAIIKAAEQLNVSKQDALNAVKFMSETINQAPKKVVVNEPTALKDQIRLEARAAREGAKSVSEAVKAITTFFKEKSNQANLTRANLKSIINIISSVKDQKTLDTAADKIYNIISSAKSEIIEVNEVAALKDQLRLEARAAREAKADLNTKRKQIAAFIRSLETKGTITARQAAALVKRVSSLNLDNETMVDRFEQYAEKVFQRAEYQDLLTKAFRTRRLIRKAIKSENQAEVVGMAKLFSKIDPSLVEDIDNYIDLAQNVLNAVRPSKEKGMDVALRQAANIEAVAEYANKEIASQEENRKRELMAEYKYLVDSGVLTENLSVKEMQEIINLIENPTAEFDPEADQKKINFLQTRLASMESVFKYMVANNINPFTGEEITIDPKDADLIKRLLKMDLTEMSIKDAAKVVEAMDNFLMNDITSGLEAAVKSYEGDQNVKQLVKQGKKARQLKSYFSFKLGKIFGEQIISLPLLFEKMFPGIKNAADIQQKMGLTDVINGTNKAIRVINDLITDYSKQDFYKEKGFMEAKNVYERGMLAFLKRNLTGTETEVRDEFKRRADIIRQSIEALRENGTDKEIEMADLYQEIYDKLGVSELDLDLIEARAEKMNKDSVAWMINQWGKYYGELSDISLSVYNSILGSDTNYTPDRYKNLSVEDKGIDESLLNSGSGFMMSMDYTDKNKTGVLMEATRPKVLPKNDKNRTTRYISLDFDVNNFNSLKGALIDINTAAAIRQVDGFINSKAFNKLVPSANDRTILTKRINTYIQKAKGKRTVTNDTVKDVERLTNFIAGLGVGKALAGIDQPIKQTVPVMINTIVNSGSTMTFVNADMNEAINRSGMPIANRGLESQTAVQSIDRLLEKEGGFGAEVIKKIEDLNQFWLKTLLAKPDVWVARSSFITYYLKELKSKGVNVKDIDWSTHKWDKDSAQYAQIMVDRQQNISDDKLAGEFLSSDDPTRRIARKVIMPFATFIMNQKARMHNDILTLRSKTSTKEDRKLAAKSLAGLSAELFSYQLIAYGIKTLVYDSIASALAGEDDEEEKKDKSLLGLKMTSKQYNATKFPVKSIVADILSPLPLTDDIITWGFDELMSNYPQISNEDIKKAVDEKNAILRLKGEDEMDAESKAKFIEQLKADNIYSVTFKNDNQNGRAYGMIGIAYDTYKEFIDLSAMAFTGEYEDEYQGRVIKKYLPEEDRKILRNISVPMMLLYSTGMVPKDFGTVARKVTNIVKKKGITENQHEKEKEVKKEINRDLNEWEIELLKSKRKSPSIVDEINYVETQGGLNNKQGKEYVKLLEVFPTPSDDMIKDIQNGKTAEQIIKKSKG